MAKGNETETTVEVGVSWMGGKAAVRNRKKKRRFAVGRRKTKKEIQIKKETWSEDSSS